MHTLHAFPFACSAAVHLALRQREVPFEIQWHPRGPARKIADPAFGALNPKRKVPALELPDGELLTEIVGILNVLDADVERTAPARRRLLEWLSFVATELHQGVLGPVFDPDTPDAAVKDLRTRILPPVIEHLEATYATRDTLLDDSEASVADLYALWAVLLLHNRWPEAVASPGLTAFRSRLTALPWVREGLRHEREHAITTPRTSG